ncbi:MAG: hypothetical protein RI554_03465 [Trueperaceae bacterium]|nr:hypothetical protein [Trueperaceae bacterium]
MTLGVAEVLGGLLAVLGGLLAAALLLAAAALVTRLHLTVEAAFVPEGGGAEGATGDAADASQRLEARIRSGPVEVRLDGLARTATLALAGRPVATRPLRAPARTPSPTKGRRRARRGGRPGGRGCRPWRLPADRRARLVATLRRETRARRHVRGHLDAHLVLDGRDPARTGTLLAALHAVRPWWDALAPDARVRIGADFTADAPRGSATAHVHVRPVRLVPPTVRVAWATVRACRHPRRSAARTGRPRPRPRAVPADPA